MPIPADHNTIISTTKKQYWTQGLIFIILNVIDAILTIVLLKMNMASEANSFLSIFDSQGMFIFKLIMPVIVLWILYRYMSRPFRVLKVLNICMLGIVIWNTIWGIIAVTI